MSEIKDRARRAFNDQQSQDNEGGVPCRMSFVAGYIEGERCLEKKLAEANAELAFYHSYSKNNVTWKKFCPVCGEKWCDEHSTKKLTIAKEALKDSLELFKQVKDVDMNTGDFMDIDNMEGRIQNALKQINQ